MAVDKQRILTKVFAQLPKHYPDKLPKDLSVLDHLLLGVIQEGTSVSSAFTALKRLVDSFYDLNELRVSHRREIEELLSDIPERDAKSKRIREILQFVFETTYAYDLETMRKKPLKQAQRQLSKISGVTPFAVAAVVQRALNGHAIPIDSEMNKILVDLGLVDEADEAEAIRTGIEHIVPKSKGVMFSMLVSELAADSENNRKIMEAMGIKLRPRKKVAAPPPARTIPISRGKQAATSSSKPAAPSATGKAKPTKKDAQAKIAASATKTPPTRGRQGNDK
jgi:endonuclease III